MVDAELEKLLAPLGVRHIEYGATPEKYVWVREALIATRWPRWRRRILGRRTKLVAGGKRIARVSSV